ncbi:hypothetical protein ABN137_25975, partial [Escherichia coli]|uniref:hypothetical protein n=1 Tax=Escherichia coli TaxID=562 RepID=UPI0032DAC1AB
LPLFTYFYPLESSLISVADTQTQMISIIICVYNSTFFCTIPGSSPSQRVLTRQKHTVLGVIPLKFYSFLYGMYK